MSFSNATRRSSFAILSTILSLTPWLWPTTGLAGALGTTITGNKTATGLLNQTDTYTWAITKSTSSSCFQIPFGSTVTVPFTIVVTRSGPTSSSSASISGNVCVTNESATASTVGLRGTDQVEYQSGSSWLPLTSQTILPISAQLNPLQNQCYPYNFSNLSIDVATQYRNHATATIDNFVGYEGTAHSIDLLYDPIVFTVQTSTVDASAQLSDTLPCPSGFTCTPSGPSGTITGTQTVTYNAAVTNNGATCGTTYTFTNTANIVTSDSHTPFDAAASASVCTEVCGCVATIGYWNNHPELIGPVLPLYLGDVGGSKTLAVTTTTIATDVLAQNVYGDPSNGITKLYAQLLAAKIAIARGASPAAIASVITAADAFLASHDYLDWASLTPQQQAVVNSWQGALANYNSGTSGTPPHCG